MPDTLLSILMPCLKCRDSGLLRERLEQQSRGLPVEVLTHFDNGELKSGVKRQALTDKAKGKYICFLDDDDWIYPNYVEELVNGCELGVDVVTFNLHMKRGDHRSDEIWYYGLDHKDERRKGLMAANHLCAWKKEIATLVGWCPFLGYGDDQLWYKTLLASNYVQSEHHIDQILYEYRFNPTASQNQSQQRVKFGRNYCRTGLRCFWTPEGTIVVEVGQLVGTRRVRHSDRVEVVTNKGKIETRDLSDLEFIAKVKSS